MGFYVLSYLCIAVFIGATGCLIYRQISLPLHVRWEIYPVQHETTARVAYGGSYMEEVNWWNNKYESSLINELKYMVPEILFLRGLWKENRSLWWFSFPFHFGLYLMIATFGLLLLHAVLTLWGLPALQQAAPARAFLDGSSPPQDGAAWSWGISAVWRLLYKRVDRSGNEKLFLFFRLFQSPVSFCSFFFPLSFPPSFSIRWLEGAKAYTYGLLTGGQSTECLRSGPKHFREDNHRVGIAFDRLYSADAHVSYVHEVFPLSQCQMG